MDGPLDTSSQAAPSQAATTIALNASAAVDCAGSWQNWQECTATCGSGLQTRTFVVDQLAQNGGLACDHRDGSVDTVQCNSQDCPVDCAGVWHVGNCTATCGGGVAPRRFTVLQPSLAGGAPCAFDDGFVATAPCGMTACVEDSDQNATTGAVFGSGAVNTAQWGEGITPGESIAAGVAAGLVVVAIAITIAALMYRRLKNRGNNKPQRTRSNRRLLSNFRRIPSTTTLVVDTELIEGDLEAGLDLGGARSAADPRMAVITEMVAQASPQSTELTALTLPCNCVELTSQTPVIASGGAGIVYCCTLKRDIVPITPTTALSPVTVATPAIEAGTQVALKEFFSMMMTSDVSEFAKELCILMALQHKYIVPFYGIYVQQTFGHTRYGRLHPNRYFLVSKLAGGGDLGTSLVQPYSKIGFSTRRRWIGEIASALSYMHSRKIVHRDIKPENVLINDEGHCQLTDFGIAKSLNTERLLTTRIGTIAFMPPEALDDDYFSHPTKAAESADQSRETGGEEAAADTGSATDSSLAWDAYSFAVLTAAVFNGRYPYHGWSAQKVVVAVLMKGLRPQMPRHLGSAGRFFLQRMWHMDPRKRPTFVEIEAAVSDEGGGSVFEDVCPSVSAFAEEEEEDGSSSEEDEEEEGEREGAEHGRGRGAGSFDGAAAQPAQLSSPSGSEDRRGSPVNSWGQRRKRAQSEDFSCSPRHGSRSPRHSSPQRAVARISRKMSKNYSEHDSEDRTKLPKGQRQSDGSVSPRTRFAQIVGAASAEGRSSRWTWPDRARPPPGAFQYPPLPAVAVRAVGAAASSAGSIRRASSTPADKAV